MDLYQVHGIPSQEREMGLLVFLVTPMLFSGCRKGGIGFKGGSLHDGLGGSGKRLALLLLVLQNAVPRGSRDSFGGFGGFGRDGYPP